MHQGGRIRKLDSGRCPLLCALCRRVIGYWDLDGEHLTETYTHTHEYSLCADLGHDGPPHCSICGAPSDHPNHGR
jgi:hypothetical protein